MKEFLLYVKIQKKLNSKLRIAYINFIVNFRIFLLLFKIASWFLEFNVFSIGIRRLL